MNNHGTNRSSLETEQQPTMALFPLKQLVVGLILLAAVVASLGLYNLNQTRTQSLRQAESQSKALAEVLQQTIGSILQKTDLMLLHVVDEVVRQSASGGLKSGEVGAFIELQFQRLQELDSLRISDASGTVILGSGHLPTVPVNIADRDYFRYLKDHPEAVMVISQPLIGKISKKWVITCARRITLANGTFGGVAYAVLPLQQFNDLLSTVPVGSRGSVSFRRDDLTLITRYSPVPHSSTNSEPGSTTVSSELQSSFSSALRSGTYTETSQIDGIRRIFSYSRVASYPLYVNVGLAFDDILADFLRERRISVAIIMIFMFLAGLLVLQVHRSIRELTALQQIMHSAAHEWQTTFDAITDSVSLIDVNHRIIRCNRATALLTKLDFNQIIGRNCWEVVHGTDGPLPECPMTRSLQTGKAESMKFQHNGRWLEVTVDPIKGDGDVLNGAVHVVRDVTEKTMTEQKLRENLELFAMFMKYSPIYTFIKEVTDTESRVIQASDNFVDMTGIPAFDMIGKTMQQIFPAEFADKITKDDQEVVAAKCIITLDEELNGRNYITYKFPIERGDGTNLLAGYTIDISERKQAEKIISQRNDAFQNLLATTLDGFWLADMAGRCLEVNETYIQQSGYSREELLTMKISDLDAHESSDETEEHIRLLMENRRDFFETQHRRKDGTVWSVEVSTTFSKVNEGGLIFAFLRDITARKAAEQALRDSQAQVIQQEKLATIGQMAAGVAHEINNPIGFIRSNLVSLGKYSDKLLSYLSLERELMVNTVHEELRSGLAAQWRRDKLDFIIDDLPDLIHESQEGAERVKKTVSDLMLFARRDGSGEMKPVDLNACIESSMTIAWNEIKSVAELKKELGNIPPVSGESHKLSQVFLNLLVNASHAVGHSGLITVRSWCEGEEVCASVSDNGTGIPEDTLPHIFEPFFTTKEAGKGTGLGLSISRDIIIKHGGRLDVESDVGTGTTFTVRLPVCSDYEGGISGE